MSNEDLQKFYEYLEHCVDILRNPNEYQGEVVETRILRKFPIIINPNLGTTDIEGSEEDMP